MEIIMKIIVFSSLIAVLVLLFCSCNDKIEVQKAYDFSLSSWYLQSKIKRGETVEIRLTLSRSGKYDGAAYFIGYVQRQGKGEVFDSDDIYLVNREQIELAALADLRVDKDGNYTFTLFYRSLSDKKSEIQFVVTDNFGQEQTLLVAFEPDTEKEDNDESAD